jgi:general secretion pathway protein D
VASSLALSAAEGAPAKKAPVIKAPGSPALASGPQAATVVGNTLRSAKGNVDFSKANPEDITNENFPNLIESFDYPNADIAEVVKAISKLTGKNFILEKGVAGKISIIAPSQITVAEAYKAFLTALAMNNYTVVPSGSFLKIRSLSVAAKESIDTYAGNYFPNADQLITRIIKLKYISAEEVQKTLRAIVNQNGDITPYIPTNSLIVTDMGSNIERITTIINQLDVPGFEEKLVVIPIKFARSKDISDLIDKIINKGDRSSANQFNAGIPRFRPAGTPGQSSGSGAANYSLVIPDLRTNSIIVVGNDAGIERIRGLVAKLDFRIRPEDGGGVYVYYVRHGEAEKIANVLNGIATDSTKKAQQTVSGQASGGMGIVPPGLPAAPTEPIFGGDVKVTADKDNNSLVITAGKQDYEIVRNILSKIDIPRDQVFVKAIFMELNITNGSNWGINYFKFLNSSGAARSSFVSGTSSVTDLADFTKDQGLTLGWGSNDTVTVTPPGGTSSIQVPSLLALIKFIKNTTNTNLLSAPQLSALDNEEAEIEVGNNVPVSNNQSITTGGTTGSSIERKDLTLKMKLTPHISPDTDSVRMKIDTKIQDITNVNISSASNLAANALAYSTRSLVTNIVVNSGDTSVLGGLMKDQDGEQVSKIPVLGDIPIIGWLFKSKKTDKQKMNLLVFLTPKIIRNTQDNADLLNNRLNDRIDFIQQNMSGRDPYGYEIDRFPRRAANDEETPAADDQTQVPAAGAKRSGPAFRDRGTKTNIEPSQDKPAEPTLNAQPAPGDAEEGE